MATLHVNSQVRFTDESGRFATSVDEGAHLAVVSLAETGADASAAAAPKRSGKLAASLVPYVISFLAAGWGTGVGYAAAQDEGAAPHAIPVNDGPLANKEQDFFSRRTVMHPGNPATRFILAGREAVRALAPSRFKAFLP